MNETSERLNAHRFTSLRHLDLRFLKGERSDLS
jgi:hypothetical protein